MAHHRRKGTDTPFRLHPAAKGKYTSSNSLPVPPTWAAVERVYSLDDEM
jgi:hypothetical protein